MLLKATACITHRFTVDAIETRGPATSPRWDDFTRSCAGSAEVMLRFANAAAP